MASGGQEKSLNEYKPKFSVTEAFSAVVQFWQITFLLKNVNKNCQDFTLWMLFFRSKTGSANISLALLWRFEATCSV